MSMDWSTFLSAITVTCEEIGNCPTKAVDVGAGLTGIVNGLTLLVGMLSVIFLIVSGLQMALSAGDPKRYGQGRQGPIYSAVGIVVALAGYSIVTFVVGHL